MLSVILLAAGESRRMGERNKLLLPFRESCFLGHIADQILAAKPDELLVVVGHEQERTRQALANRPIQFVENPNLCRRHDNFDSGRDLSLIHI